MLTTTAAEAEYYESSTFSLSEDQFRRGVGYEEIVDTAAPPQWTQVCLTNHITAEIPYSPHWRVDGLKLQPIYRSTSGDSFDWNGAIWEASFGPFVSGGTYMMSQYTIVIQPAAHEVSLELSDILEGARGRCPSPVPPSLRRVGNTDGVLYLEGGAKGCSTVFEFFHDQTRIMLSKFDGIGTEATREITWEMARIISSIRGSDVQCE